MVKAVRNNSSSCSRFKISEYRYERKFQLLNHSKTEVDNLIFLHPAMFREIFYERQINNIYFDSFGFKSFYANTEGDRNRKKFRIRWYGEKFGSIDKPTLEVKIKKGLVGKKLAIPLSSFQLDRYFDFELFSKSMKSDIKEIEELTDLLSYCPVLLSSYKRRYFLSFDQKFRLTVDYDQSFCRMDKLNNFFLAENIDQETVIVELKYEIENETFANEVITKFPFRMTKNSKYVNGINLTRFMAI
jgi:SPX domain protein involved in polyphosphate accumulation